MFNLICNIAVEEVDMLSWFRCDTSVFITSAKRRRMTVTCLHVSRASSKWCLSTDWVVTMLTCNAVFEFHCRHPSVWCCKDLQIIIHNLLGQGRRCLVYSYFEMTLCRLFSPEVFGQWQQKQNAPMNPWSSLVLCSVAFNDFTRQCNKNRLRVIK